MHASVKAGLSIRDRQIGHFDIGDSERALTIGDFGGSDFCSILDVFGVSQREKSSEKQFMRIFKNSFNLDSRVYSRMYGGITHDSN